jgi:hypothetical protein
VLKGYPKVRSDLMEGREREFEKRSPIMEGAFIISLALELGGS